MRSRSTIFSLTLLAVTPGLCALGQSDSYVGSTANFSIASKTDVPGKTLNPGHYAIVIVDQFSDRMVVRVQNETSKDHVIFLGVPQPAIGQTAAQGPVEWKSGPTSEPALRGFAFSPHAGVEFVYPKGEAVQIATRNSAKVVAVDPDSESLPPVKNMSKDDMQMVSLWTLSLTSIGPKDKTPAIAAQRYQAEPVNTTPAPVVAQLAPVAPSQPQEVASLEQPKLPQSNTTPAQARRRPVIAKLPHTGSPVTSIAFFGILCLMAAGFLRLGSIFTNWHASRG
jgi:hypothetical protein